MKTIAVATDLTPNANRAAHFGFQLAKAQQAGLLLINAFHFLPTNPAENKGASPFSARSMREVSQRALNHLAGQLHKQYGDDVSIRCVTQEGYSIAAIRDVVRTENVDLLIMSTVGSAPQSAQLMGSVATQMIAETRIPLLLIPPSVHYAAITNVVLAIDLDTPPDAVTLDVAQHFARQFDCTIDVLCIYDKPIDIAVHSRAEHIRRLITVPHTLTILPGADVHDALLTFAHTNKADLIMMLPQAHSWFRQLFTGGETLQTARLTDIPLLAIV